MTIHKMLAPVLAVAFSAIASASFAADANEHIKFLDLAGRRYEISGDRKFMEYAHWTKEEKAIVISDMTDINNSHPELTTVLYKQIPELFFVRSRLKRKLDGKMKYLYIARVYEGRLELPPKYFTQNKEMRVAILYHELIHLLDVGQRISLSKEWVKAVNPLISRIRVLSACGLIKRAKSQHDTLPTEFNWPNYYACKNTTEALAEYCTLTQLGTFAPIESLTPLANKLMHPSESDFAFAREYQKGQTLLNQGHFEQATTFFKRAIEIDPNVAEAHFRLSVCMRHATQQQARLMELNRTIDLLNEATVTTGDPHIASIFSSRARVLRRMKDWKELKAAYESCLQYKPDDSTILKMHMGVCRTLNDLSQAAYDCYEIKHPTKNLAIDAIKAGCQDDKFTLESLETALKQQSKPDPLVLPTYFAWLAQNAHSEIERQKFFEMTLAALPSMNEEAIDERVLLLKAKTLIKLGRYSEAQECADTLRKHSPESPTILVIIIALLEALNESAAPEYARFRDVTGPI